MRDINLLPWRDCLKQKRKRKFLLLLSMVTFLHLLGWIFLHSTLSNNIQRQQQQANILQQKINLLILKNNYAKNFTH